MSNTEICPCIECICVPICKHKNYQDLVLQCTILYDIVYGKRPTVASVYGVVSVSSSTSQSKSTREKFVRLVRQVEEYLQPSLWNVAKEEDIKHTPFAYALIESNKRDITNG